MPPVKSAFNLQELPKVRDGLSFLHLEHAKIEQDQHGIMVLSDIGAVSTPITGLGVLTLGPGTSITHAAIKALAQNGCSIFWVGEENLRFYAAGTGETRSSRNHMRQARLWADASSHLEVAKRAREHAGATARL
jgi:CRISP-associated protein Cas1